MVTGAARPLLRLAVAAALALALGPASATLRTVDARNYKAFWLWAGVRPQPVLDTAERLYLLQGEVEDGPPVRLVSRRPSVPHVGSLAGRPEVWLVIRTETLAWSPETFAQVDRALTLWRDAGNRVAGVEIDFDAKSRRLAAYAAFLKDLHARLPPDCRLGITGLLDWSANGDPAGLDALAGTVDEAVLQVYQGRRTIPGYAAYFGRLARIRMPFRIGLLQGGDWLPPESLSQNARFAGYVVFLRNH